MSKNKDRTLNDFFHSVGVNYTYYYGTTLPATGYERSKQDLLKLAEEIEESKSPAYTQDDNDVLYNFKQAAKMNGITSKQAWGVHLYKHISALLSYAKDPEIEQAEELDERFADAINYLKLGYYMYQKDKESNINQKKLPF